MKQVVEKLQKLSVESTIIPSLESSGFMNILFIITGSYAPVKYGKLSVSVVDASDIFTPNMLCF